MLHQTKNRFSDLRAAQYFRIGVVAFLTVFFYAAGQNFVSAGETLRNQKLGYSAYFPTANDPGSSAPLWVTLPAHEIKADQDVDLWAFSAEKSGWATVSIDMDYARLARISDAERRIEAVLEDIGRTRQIDRQKVVIAGTATGGMLAISLGLKYPENYAAVAVASGGALRAVDLAGLMGARKQNFFMIHGAKNKYMPIEEFNATVKNLKEYGADVQSKVYPECDHVLPTRAYSGLISDVTDFLQSKR